MDNILSLNNNLFINNNIILTDIINKLQNVIENVNSDIIINRIRDIINIINKLLEDNKKNTDLIRKDIQK